MCFGVEKGPRYGVRPCGWTRSDWGFDRLPGVLILELRGAEIAERGVQSFGVVNLIDEVRKIRGHVLECLVSGQVNGLDL